MERGGSRVVMTTAFVSQASVSVGAMQNRSHPLEVIAELKGMAEDGEPLVLVPIDGAGEATGEPEVTWHAPRGRRLN